MKANIKAIRLTKLTHQSYTIKQILRSSSYFYHLLCFFFYLLLRCRLFRDLSDEDEELEDSEEEPLYDSESELEDELEDELDELES